MKKNLTAILAVLLVAALVVAGVFMSQKNTLQKEVDDLKAKVTEVTTELDGMKAEAAKAAEEAAKAAEEAAAKAAEEAAKAAEEAAKGGYKIAILTGTTSQGEEEFRAAETLKEKYPDIVLTDTYPDNFSAETETTIGKLLKFASDPQVKAIIMTQAVQGATAAFTQIKTDLKRDDILLIAGVPAETPASITAAADVVLGVDEINGGEQIVETAKEWGVDVLVHLSFARHMSYETIVARHNIMKAASENAGIQMVDYDVPDPTGDAGMSGAQNAMLELVPKIMQTDFPGKKVAFFTTNCGLQEALQTAVLAQPNAYYPLPCCPSPFHGFPSSLGLEVKPEDYGDIDAYIASAAKVLEENDAVGRFSTWAVPVNMSMISGGFEYAKNYIENGGEKFDATKVAEALTKAAGVEAAVSTYVDDNGVEYPNYLMIPGLLPQAGGANHTNRNPYGGKRHCAGAA